MDTMAAHALGKAARARGAALMVFDWDKAARLIRERGAQEASAGLNSDWEWTGGEILTGGEPAPREDCHAYLASLWVIPEIEIDGELMDCWCHHDEWDAYTVWPESALAILRA